MFIEVLEHVQTCYYPKDGVKIRNLVLQALQNHEQVTLSFQNVPFIPSHFGNEALVSLLDVYDFHFIKSHLRIIHATKPINTIIKHCFENEIRKQNLHQYKNW